MVDADDLVVSARGEVAAVGREADGVDGTEVVAHVAELARLVVASILGVVDGIGRPDTDVAICRERDVSEAVFQFEKGGHEVARIPPPAVASLEPSGETWQL